MTYIWGVRAFVNPIHFLSMGIPANPPRGDEASPSTSVWENNYWWENPPEQLL